MTKIPERYTGHMRNSLPYHEMSDAQKARSDRNTAKQERHVRNRADRAIRQREKK